MSLVDKKYFEFFCPVKIIAGKQALEHMAFELSLLGARRPLLITDAGVRGAGLADTVLGALGAGGVEPVAVFDQVPPDSSTRVVGEIARLYREKDGDAILAVGGGSVIDTAKAANILASLGGDDVKAYSGTHVLQGHLSGAQERVTGASARSRALGRRLRPLFVLPTTSGTGSEVTNVAVVKDEASGVKLPFQSQYLLPDCAVLDPRLTLGLPPLLTAATAMDAMTHAVEAFTCLAKNPLSDAYATAAIKKIAENLVPLLESPRDAERRLELALAATMAGIAFSSSMVGLVHALGHSVGAVAHVHHGVCMNVLLPYVLEYNLPARAEVIGELLLPLAGAEVYARTPLADRPAAAIRALRNLRDELHRLAGLPRTLSETGKVTRGQLDAIARMSLDDGSLMTNPVEVDHAAALGVLSNAF